MNKTTVFDNDSIWIFEQIYQPLYTVSKDGKGTVPYLATGYTESANKLTYTFKLRSGVKFSNGKPMTSADVKFSIEQDLKAAQGWAYIDTAIKSVDDPTPSTVVINLKFPWAPLIADLSLFANAIIPNNYARRVGNRVLRAPDRDRPVQVGLLAQGPGAQAGQEPVLLAEGPALPEQRDLDRRAQRQHPRAPAQGRPGAHRRVPGLVDGLDPQVHDRREHGPVQLDPDQLPVLQRERSSRSRTCTCGGPSRWRSTGTRWSRPCCSATASRPTRCSRRRCRTTTRSTPGLQYDLTQAKKEMAAVQRPEWLHHDDPDPVRQL